MKEKLDLSLDHRQVVSLLLSGLVVLGAVFVLGVVVGKKLAVSPGAANAPDLLATLDRKSRAIDKVPESPALTFPEELTRKGVDPVVPDAGHVAVAPVAVPVAAKPKPPEPKAEPDAIVASPKAAPEPESAPAPKTEPSPSEPRNSDKLKDALARAEKPDSKPDTKPSHAAVALPASGAFTLQLAATSTRSEAERHVSKLKERGYAPYIVSAEVPGKGTWYRVRMGNFASKEAAQKFLSDFKRETQIDAFIANAP
jgi:cell division septation protein DedD